MNTTERIKEARKTLRQQETKKAELDGKRKALQERLWKDHKLKTIKAAEDKVDELEAQIKAAEKKLTKMMTKLDSFQTELEEANDAD